MSGIDSEEGWTLPAISKIATDATAIRNFNISLLLNNNYARTYFTGVLASIHRCTTQGLCQQQHNPIEAPKTCSLERKMATGYSRSPLAKVYWMSFSDTTAVGAASLI